MATAKPKKAVKVSSINSSVSDSMDNNWRAENDLDTLMRAIEIKGDAKRLKAAMAVADQRKKDLAELQEDVDEDAADEQEEKAESPAERAKEKAAGDTD